MLIGLYLQASIACYLQSSDLIENLETDLDIPQINKNIFQRQNKFNLSGLK